MKTVEQTFNLLSQEWKRDTAALSLTSQKVTHPAYLRIIGLGSPVLPFIFQAMKRQPAQWMVALQAITGENPVANGSTVSQAVEAWLKWGAENGHAA